MKLLLVSLACWATAGSATGDVSKEAGALVARKRHAEAAELLVHWLQRNEGSPEEHELYAEALAGLDRLDESAFHAERARTLLREADDDGSRSYRALTNDLAKRDPLARRRDAFFKEVTKTWLDLAKRLEKDEQGERAGGLLARVTPHATGKERRELEKLAARLASATREVDLGGTQTAEGTLPLLELESKRYELACHLERDVAERLADTMDDIFESYVQVYFEGDGRRASGRKATLHIHPSHAAMMKHWTDPSRSVGGWWSPGEWVVHAYDTRSDQGSLEPMLETLFHEASHQFMTMLSKGASPPSWLNEGTASFFEGARAMEDGRVLWPDAARNRLLSLTGMLTRGNGPDVFDVISYDEPGSYAGEYYPFGWGLVYYFLQYEDPETLAYVWRPYYDAYTQRITTRGGEPYEVFEEIFLAPGNPGGFEDFDAFRAAWSEWIRSEVFPLHQGRDIERLRRAKLTRYLEAANRVRDGADAGTVTEAEFLERALQHADSLRNGAVTPDGEILLLQAELLQRLARDGTAAFFIEAALALVEEGSFELAEDRRAALEARLSELDGQSSPLRTLRLKERLLRTKARRLADDYAALERPYLLRAFTFALEAGRLFDDTEVLLPRADELRRETVAHGLVPSRIVQVGAGAWQNLSEDDDVAEFEAERGEVMLAISARMSARLALDVPIEGDAEVRALVQAEGDVWRSSFLGVVVSGTPQGTWWAVGLSRDELALVACERDASGAPSYRTKRTWRVNPPLGENEPPLLAVRLQPDGTLTLRFGEDPEREPVRTELPEPLPAIRFVGILVKDARLKLSDFLVEIFP